MLSIQLLPAGCGDCLWIEYGEPGATRIVLIDGGEGPTIKALERRIAKACGERGTKTLDVELLVVTHIDNDHIEGILELLEAETALVRPKDVWFNGRSQLMGLPPRDPAKSKRKKRARATKGASDFLGGGDDEENGEDDELLESRISPADLLGPAEGDRLSEILTKQRLPWNRHATWHGQAVVVREDGALPVAELDGGLRLTLLGPTMDDLYKLSAAWPDVLGGKDEPSEEPLTDDFLGKLDTWPPKWSDKITHDPSKANGSSIMLLAEYGKASLLLPGDGHGPDLADALIRLQEERGHGEAPLTLSGFKVSHHGSSKNVSREVIEQIDCGRYLLSTDGSKHRHPDHQTMLRILRYSKEAPSFFFNYATATTTPWRDNKSDVPHDDFQDYETTYPEDGRDGVVLTLDTASAS
jgi:beta-lactamase superfamily II metal-dependent hydrolase